MGHKDLESLHKIYEQIKKISKEKNLSYQFKVDDGSFETAIEFTENKCFHPPISLNWDSNPNIICPDLLDWEHKIVIEYEEEVGGVLPGAKLAKKGHHRSGDMDNKRDSRRNLFYDEFSFHTLRIWDSEELWENRLEEFLILMNIKHTVK